MNDPFCPLSYLLKQKKFFFPTYLPIDQIVESERGNKQYFNLGLIYTNALLLYGLSGRFETWHNAPLRKICTHFYINFILTIIGVYI
jgi:hypothetical protein